MGSGSSKSKKAEPPKTRPDKVSKVQANQNTTLKSDTTKSDQNSNKNLKNQNVEIEKVKNDKNLDKLAERTSEVKSFSNGNVAKVQPVEKLESFESDSESEAEDINAVLAATRAEHNYRAQKSLQKPTEYYPETYAQRLQREQYEKNQQSLIRQKTIYRNPDEWELDEVSTANL